MRRILFFVFSLLFVFKAFSKDFSVSNGIVLDGYAGIDYLILINGITLATEIKYGGSYSNINWYNFANPNSSISNLPDFSPDDDTGYIVRTDNNKYTIWVIDYQTYLRDFESKVLDIKPETFEECDEIILTLIPNLLPMQYTDSLGSTHTIQREFSLTWQTKDWNGTEWVDLDKDSTVTIPPNEIVVATPLKDTKFELSGDQFADQLGISPPKLESEIYYTVKVEGKITTIASLREALNEDERPSDQEQETWSAPLYMLFKSNPSNQDNYYQPLYLWSIYKEDRLIITRTDEEHRYTFYEPGEYRVVLELKSSRGDCIFEGEKKITVNLSDLQVPNVFTPNGDGKNDEFRVAYRSLASFECWVYNNWGNLVYHSTDPEKGWNGKINGKDASPGAYFYIIRAKGTDGVKHNKKGDINLIR